MRLVAVSIVKNEADIIEAFVRHTATWVDRHLILDHDSTDGTRAILQALRAEGLPLRLFTDDVLGKLQQFRSNYLTRLAARELGADWVVPLDADEMLSGPDRAALEAELQRDETRPRSLPLLNYTATDADAAGEPNPVLRLQHCEKGANHTRKVMVPRALALDEGVIAGMGSHELRRGETAIPDLPLPDAFHLAHLPLRSQEHLALRVIQAELQKQSHGQAHANVDVHYRLGFQLLAEDPGRFFAIMRSPSADLERRPIAYRGGPLRHATGATDWSRVARALLPFLEKMASSHGRLTDALGGRSPASATPVIRELLPDEGASLPAGFSGFTVIEGLGPDEGPVPPAFLPRFRWGYAPQTRLHVTVAAAGVGQLQAEALTYSPKQRLTVRVNGVGVREFAFSRINQKEAVVTALPLRAGYNEISLHYEQSLVTPHDPRRLAVIFLSLLVTAPEAPR